MVVVVPRIPDAWVGMLVLDGLEAREGIGEYTDPLMVLKCDESRVYGDKFRPHDGAGLFRPNCVYKYGPLLTLGSPHCRIHPCIPSFLG